jgi:hypothetical protein
MLFVRSLCCLPACLSACALLLPARSCAKGDECDRACPMQEVVMLSSDEGVLEGDVLERELPDLPYQWVSNKLSTA